jgi:hypothetical protein
VIKISYKSATKLKSESKCGEKFSNLFSEIWKKLKLKNENILTDSFLFIFYFSHFDRISHHKEGWFSLYYNCEHKELSELIKQVQMLGKSLKLECFFWGEFLQPEKENKSKVQKIQRGVFFGGKKMTPITKR